MACSPWAWKSSAVSNPTTWNIHPYKDLMAISYSLAIATPSDARALALSLSQAASALSLLGATTPEAFLDGADLAQGTWVLVAPMNPRPWNPVVADLGFTPTAWVAFRLTKESSSERQVDDVLRLSVGLLDRVTGDAVLHREYEEILLLRRSGRLTLSERDELWTPERLGAVSPRPFHRETHAFSEE